jgi:anti-sigma B factor antagonist
VEKMIELTITEHQIEDVTILHLSGDITFGVGNIKLRTIIRRLLAEEKKKIHLNLKSVGYVDSSGVGELISSFTAINRRGGELKLFNLPERVKELLIISKLLCFFEIYEEQNLFAGHS